MYLLYFVYQLVHYEEKKRKKRFTCTWRHFTVLHSKYFVYWYILYEEKNKRKSQRRDYLFIGKFRRNPFDIFCSWYISPQASRFISQHTRAKRLKQHKHVLGEYMYKWTEKDKISARPFVALLCYFFFFFNANDMKLLRALTMVAFQSCARIFRIQLLYIFYMCSVIDDAWGIGIISYHSICLGHFNTESFSFPSHSRSTEFMRFFYFYRIVSVQE